MFTFHWSELLVVVIGGLVLFIGLVLLVLRRRNEVLQDFLTPEEPNLEEEFFRARKLQQEKTSPEQDTETEPEPDNVSEESNGDAVQWGTQTSEEKV